MPENVFSLVGMLVAVAVVLLLAYGFTRFIAGRTFGGMARTGGHMRILDQLLLSKDHKIALVQVGERWLLVGVAPSGITLLAELSEEERTLWLSGAQGETTPSFGEAFSKALRDRLKK